MHSARSIKIAFITVCFLLVSIGFAAAQASSSGSSGHVVELHNLLANIEKSVDSKKAKTGDPITAKTVTAVTLSDGTAVPVGSVLVGHVDSATPSENKGDSTLVVTFDKLQLKGGKEILVKAVIVNVALVSNVASPMMATNPNNDTSSSIRPKSTGDLERPGSGSGPAGQPGTTAPEGLTVKGSSSESTSGTFTQVKRNVHLSNATQLQVALAAVQGSVAK